MNHPARVDRRDRRSESQKRWGYCNERFELHLFLLGLMLVLIDDALVDAEWETRTDVDIDPVMLMKASAGLAAKTRVESTPGSCDGTANRTWPYIPPSPTDVIMASTAATATATSTTTTFTAQKTGKANWRGGREQTAERDERWAGREWFCGTRRNNTFG